MNRVAHERIKEMRHNEEMVMTQQDKIDFRNATQCHVCQGQFADENHAESKWDIDHFKVPDHDHRTGCYRGAAQIRGNLDYYHQRYVSVCFHNLKGYDAHMIIKEAYNIREGLKVTNIKVIPTAMRNT